MAVDASKVAPRILLISGGIEFQRADNKLSSMDTLIEQEDTYIEILIEKIMSLKPDIILVRRHDNLLIMIKQLLMALIVIIIIAIKFNH
jgi:hypothetical protein